MPAKSASVPRRLAAWSLFHALSLLVGVITVRRVDVILTPSPPLSIGIVAWMLGGWHRAPFIYNVQELYPDIAINLGAVRNRTAIRLLFALERFVYARAARITLIAERMRRRLVEKGVPAARTVVIPNFVDMNLLRAVPSPNGFTRGPDIDGRFVICYAGNLGPARVSTPCSTPRGSSPTSRRLCWCWSAAAQLWNHLGTRIREEQLNVRLVAHQPISRVPEIYGASHLSGRLAGGRDRQRRRPVEGAHHGVRRGRAGGHRRRVDRAPDRRRWVRVRRSTGVAAGHCVGHPRRLPTPRVPGRHGRVRPAPRARPLRAAVVTARYDALIDEFEGTCGMEAPTGARRRACWATSSGGSPAIGWRPGPRCGR
jgi:hypothetical protein